MIDIAVLPARVRKFNSIKRAIDLTLILVTLPIMIPLVALVSLVLFVTEGRPVIYKQKRIGYLEQTVSVLKFRTMSNERDEGNQLLPDSQRITTIGRFLRKTSLDELPQLLNIALGQLSFVGPRPLHPQYLDHYSESERVRHWVRPGVTGLAQVNGRNFLAWDQRLDLDRQYVETASLTLDLKIALKTVMAVLRSDGMSVSPGETGGRFLHVYRTFPEYGGYRLRALEAGDLAERVRWLDDPSTREYMSLTGEVDLESTQRWFAAHLKNDKKFDFAVIDHETDDVVAMVGVDEVTPRSGLTYIMVSPDVRGRGIGSVSQRLLYEWVFTHRGFNDICSSVRKENAASVRVHTQLGATVFEETEDRLMLRQTESQFLAATGRRPGIVPLENL